MENLSLENFNDNGVKIIQTPGAPSSATLGALDQLVIVLPEKVPASAWRTLPQGNKLQALMKRRSRGQVPAVVTRMNNKRQTAVLVGTVSSESEAFEQLVFGRKMLAAALSERAGSLGVWVLGFSDTDTGKIIARVTAAALSAGFNLADFKTRPKPPRLKSLRIIGHEKRMDLSRVEAEASGNNLARWLTAMPPNKLDASAYTSFLQQLAKARGWTFRKYGVRELEKMGAGAFLAVAQGNADDSAAIVRLQYRPDAKSTAPDLTLVGKGIIFDTGGNNLKPFQSMADMHIDMGGSAVAAGTLLAITKLALPQAVDCWLPITENRIGPTAYKSQDVITAINGKTIQAVHTDAEGRLALADALVLACRDNPRLIVDYATLTGACINAITRSYCGVFTNRPDWHPLLKKAGRQSGERVWPFPCGKEFLPDLESDVADIKQCTPEAGGDHILAATFLNEFVSKEIPWIHIDLSASKRKGGLGAVATDITGFGVGYTMNLILEQKLPEGAA